MNKTYYKIVIKGKEEGISVKCRGKASVDDVIDGISSAFVGVTRNLGVPFEEAIKTLKEKENEMTKKGRKNVESSSHSGKTSK